MIFEDQIGRKVELKGVPKRIISLVPSQTELLAHLDLDEEVVGITKFCIHPSKWHRSKVKIGGTKQVHLGRIRDLRPDLILANKEENTEEMVLDLMEIAPVWVSDVNDLSSALEMIEQISLITNRQDKGDQLVEKITHSIEAWQKELSGRNPLTVKYFIWRSPNMLAGRGTFIDSMLKLAGFMNLEDRLRYPTDNAEKNPEIVLLSSEPYPFSDQHIEEFRSAYPKAVILLVDGEYFSWYGSKMLQAPNYFKELWMEINECISRRKES